MTPPSANLAPGVRTIVVGNHRWPSPPTKNDVDLPVLIGLQERLGGEMHVIVQGEAPDIERWRTRDLRITLLPNSGRLTFLRNARRLVSGLTAEAPAVLVASDVWGGFACRPSRSVTRPLLVQVQGEILSPGPAYGSRRKRAALRLTARHLVKAADGVRAVNHDLAEQIRAIAPEVPVRVVGTRVNTEIFHPRKTTPRPELRIISVGTLSVLKNARILLQAMPEVIAAVPRVTLSLVGEGDQRSALQAMAQELGIERHVSFAGQLSNADVARALRDADIFASASYSEGQPRAALEAMASGLPSVLSDIVGHRSIVSAGGTAILVEPQISDRWSEAFITLAHHPDERERLGAEGRAHVVAKHGFESQLDSFSRFIRDLASEAAGNEAVEEP